MYINFLVYHWNTDLKSEINIFKSLLVHSLKGFFLNQNKVLDFAQFLSTFKVKRHCIWLAVYFDCTFRENT